MWANLRHYGVPKKIIKAIKCVYDDRSSVLQKSDVTGVVWLGCP